MYSNHWIYPYSSLSIYSSQNCYFYRSQSILGLNQSVYISSCHFLFEFIFGLILLKLSHTREHPATFFLYAFPLSSSLKSYYVIRIFIFSLFNSVDHCSVFLIIYQCFLLSLEIFLSCDSLRFFLLLFQMSSVSPKCFFCLSLVRE